jgi:hypothetical protein
VNSFLPSKPSPAPSTPDTRPLLPLALQLSLRPPRATGARGRASSCLTPGSSGGLSTGGGGSTRVRVTGLLLGSPVLVIAGPVPLVFCRGGTFTSISASSPTLTSARMNSAAESRAPPPPTVHWEAGRTLAQDICGGSPERMGPSEVVELTRAAVDGTRLRMEVRGRDRVRSDLILGGSIAADFPRWCRGRISTQPTPSPRQSPVPHVLCRDTSRA